MTPPRRSYEEVGEFFGSGWRSGPVRRAISFRVRWRGLSPRPAGVGLWLGGNSVHSMGMKEALWVCGLDPSQVVGEVRELRPGRLHRLRRATSVLELPRHTMPPAPGMVLTWIDARDLAPLRDSDRQPE